MLPAREKYVLHVTGIARDAGKGDGGDVLVY